MAEAFVMDIEDQKIIIDYLHAAYERQEKSDYYSKGASISWEQHLETLGYDPAFDLWEEKSSDIYQAFLKEFFTDADPNEWWNIEYVTLQQSVALTFGKNPNTIDWTLLNTLRTVPIAIELQNFCTKMRSTLYHGTDSIKLITLLEWLSHNKIAGLDQTFITSLIQKRDDFTDWETEYKALQIENAEMKEQLTELQKITSSSKSGETNAKNTLYKIIIGVAI